MSNLRLVIQHYYEHDILDYLDLRRQLGTINYSELSKPQIEFEDNTKVTWRESH